MELCGTDASAYGQTSAWPLIATVCACVALTMLIPKEPAYAQGSIEHTFGASNVEAITGNQRLTVGVSQEGDLSVLAWPSPTFYDQLHYIALNGTEARGMPRMGALEGMGSYAALRFDDGSVSLLHNDDDWERLITYTDDETSVVSTSFTHTTRALSVTQLDVVSEREDVLARHYIVEGDERAAVTHLLYYANLAPTTSRIPFLPVAEFLLDHYNDYLALWDDSDGSILQFRPDDNGEADFFAHLLGPPQRDFGPAAELLTNENLDLSDVAQALAVLESSYDEGVYIRMGSTPEPDQHQVGADTTDTCSLLDQLGDNIDEVLATTGEQGLPIDPAALDQLRCGDFAPYGTIAAQEGWVYAPQDARLDLEDGELQGGLLAGAQVNTALRVPFADEGTQAIATIYFAFGYNDEGAQGALSAARERGFEAIADEAEEAHRDWARRVFIPEGFSETMTRFSLRAFLNLRVGTDRDTGAIVASITRQAPYHLDWPRDGVFFNQALDIAGFSELVTQRMDFYASTIRDREQRPQFLIDNPVPGWPDCSSCRNYPPDSWEMNFYADGEVGGNTRLEIDNTALLVWYYAAHAGYIDEVDLQAYLERIWPTVERASEFLHDWRDPETGLTWPANEDDNFAFTQGLQAAVTTYAALRGATSIALELGYEGHAYRWVRRAEELKEATLRELYEPFGHFRSFPDATQRTVAGPATWLAWPARMLPWDDERVINQLEYGLDELLPRIRGEGAGGGYFTKLGVSAALVLNDEDRRLEALEIAETLAGDIAPQTTLYLGEVFINADTTGDGETDTRINAVSTPHLWAAVLVYLNAAAYYAPERFDPYLNVLPSADEAFALDPPDGDEGGGGAGESSGDGCTTVDSSASIPSVILLALLTVFIARRLAHRRACGPL